MGVTPARGQLACRCGRCRATPAHRGWRRLWSVTRRCSRPGPDLDAEGLTSRRLLGERYVDRRQLSARGTA
jgi:hypothetical protein